jgi:hypothetical protein
MTKQAIFACVFFGATQLPTIAATVLIDPTVRNGGFESGVASPWGGVTAVLDSSFASSGSYYGSVAGTRADVFQFLPISTTNGMQLSLTFSARIPVTGGFDSFSVSVSDTGFSKTASVVTLTSPPLSSSGWNQYSYSITLTPGWNDTGNSKLSIAFPLSSGSRIAYLDDVTFSQVPEVSSGGLILFSSVISIFLRRLRPH